jgi:phosphoglycolate phosphatase-like HAD superfamily hydrolase
VSKRWSYKVVEMKPQWLGIKAKQLEETLAALGQQGWELVSVTTNGMNAMLYLKKEI